MKCILFVDDESDLLDGIRRLLHADRERRDMQFALGGEGALRTCDAGSFDVVVSDLRMPEMDGATPLSHIRDRFPKRILTARRRGSFNTDSLSFLPSVVSIQT